jgi:hypothetical protein
MISFAISYVNVTIQEKERRDFCVCAGEQRETVAVQGSS